VTAVGSIAKVISEMNTISGSVAAAVQQQGAATSEISRNVEQASAGTHEVSRNITSVETAAKETGAAAHQIAASAEDLSVQSDKLKRAVSAFLDTVRGDTDQMRLMSWDEGLSVDSGGEIDAHHKNLINQVNTFYGRMMSGDAGVGATQMLNTLATTLKQHFVDEENLMSRNKYPRFAEHQQQHQDCMKKYDQLRHGVETNKAGATKDLFEFVVFWLKDHIGKQDRAMADYMRSRRGTA
jgi:hemerythrin-like metal-binding protein